MRDAGLHVVLATGRGVHSAVPVATELGLTEGWVVCSNGAVTARLDPAAENGYEIVRVVTFDPGPALRTIALELPDALYAVEDLGLGLPGVRATSRTASCPATWRSSRGRS